MAPLFPRGHRLDCGLGSNTAIWDYAWIKQSYPHELICHHTLQSCGYEFGLGLWRQSSADLANNLQCEMVIFIEECQHVDRRIRANKPWWFTGYHSSQCWRRQQTGLYLLPSTLGYLLSTERVFLVCCFPSNRPLPGVAHGEANNSECTAGDIWDVSDTLWDSSCSSDGKGCHHTQLHHWSLQMLPRPDEAANLLL